MKPKTKEVLELTVSDALANLSALAEMKLDVNEPIGIVKKHKLVIQDEEFSYRTIDWFLTENVEELIENVKESYQILFDYIKMIYDKDFIDWDDPKCRKGFQAIMVMASEAANKVDQYIELLPKQPTTEKISELEIYKEIKEFYLDKIVKKFTETLEGEQPWEEEWHVNEKALLLDVEKSGLKDFESLKKDEQYELFYLVDEDEKPFLDPQLIRNIKLFCDYDEEALKKIDEDPLLKIRIFLDKDFQEASKQILNTSFRYISSYFEGKYQREIESDFISYINEAIFALMLASNPKNLITHSFFKNSIEYFHDFQAFLRNILLTDEYQKIVAYPTEDKRSKCILDLIHTLCKNLYLRTTAIKQEIIGFIHLLIRRGDEFRKFKYPEHLSFWSTLLENDESIHLFLNSFPNGPLMKILDAIREENLKGFDPMQQDNVAQRVFHIQNNINEVVVLRVPSPTFQQTISHAHVIEEFKGFLKALNSNERYLFLNLQDKDSFKDSARFKAIDALQKRTDIRNNIVIVNLDKHSDFYHQAGIFLSLNDASDFIKEFKDQIITKNSFTKDILEFINSSIEMIHKFFFDNKNVLSRKNRLDFIEIFYNFLVLKLIEVFSPKIMSFTCKDAIDLGPNATAQFYSFLKIIKSEKFAKENEDFFRWLVYSSAILIRERAVNSSNLIRNVSAINTMEIEMMARFEKIMKAVSHLYDPAFIKSITIIEH